MRILETSEAKQKQLSVEKILLFKTTYARCEVNRNIVSYGYDCVMTTIQYDTTTK
jgi:hypothetical protein